jgi:hypothetical protein
VGREDLRHPARAGRQQRARQVGSGLRRAAASKTSRWTGRREAPFAHFPRPQRRTGPSSSHQRGTPIAVQTPRAR